MSNITFVAVPAGLWLFGRFRCGHFIKLLVVEFEFPFKVVALYGKENTTFFYIYKYTNVVNTCYSKGGGECHIFIFCFQSI